MGCCRSRNRSSEPAYRVSVIERRADGTESISLTVHPGSAALRDISRVLQSALQQHWRTTDVADRRHKRRH